MKRILFALVAATFACCGNPAEMVAEPTPLPPHTPGQKTDGPQDTRPLRILAMGDSITRGTDGTPGLGGYRGALYTLLGDAGYEVDFVGTQTENSDDIVDMEYEAIGGINIQRLHDERVTPFLAQLEPDVILLHVGINDFAGGIGEGAIERLDALVADMTVICPNAKIIITNLLETNGTKSHLNEPAENLFNPFVYDVAERNGDNVMFWDIRSAVSSDTDHMRKVHPKQPGYDQMAAAWFSAIEMAL